MIPRGIEGFCERIEERLERVERLLAGEVEAVDVATGTRRFFAGQHKVSRCSERYAASCSNGEPMEERDGRPEVTGPIQPIGSLPVGDPVTFWDESHEPYAWWCYRITATARGLEMRETKW